MPQIANEIDHAKPGSHADYADGRWRHPPIPIYHLTGQRPWRVGVSAHPDELWFPMQGSTGVYVENHARLPSPRRHRSSTHSTRMVVHLLSLPNTDHRANHGVDKISPRKRF